MRNVAFALACGGGVMVSSGAVADCDMDARSAFKAATEAAVREIGSPPLLMPDYGSDKVAIAPMGACRLEIRFIASSPLDFARRVQATLEQDGASGTWRVIALDISGRIDPFSTP